MFLQHTRYGTSNYVSHQLKQDMQLVLGFDTLYKPNTSQASGVYSAVSKRGAVWLASLDKPGLQVEETEHTINTKRP